MTLGRPVGLPDPNSPLRFSILLPVHRLPAMLPYAIETVLAQTLTEFELLIIGDGAPEESIACARAYAARDPRVKVSSFPKGAGCGEAYRHAALGTARGRNIAHIADDDLWFPNHLEEIEKLLQTVDFGHLIHVSVNGDGGLEILPADLSSPRLRQRMLTEDYNAFGDTVTGYRLNAYRRLPEGWTPGPAARFPDLLMWRKFLRQTDLTFGTRNVITALIFPTDIRQHMSLEDRGREVRQWQKRIGNSAEREDIVQRAWRSLMRDFMHMEDDRRARLRVIEAMNAQFNAIERTSYNRLPTNGEIDFSELGNSFLYTVSGWSYPEAGFRWTDGQKASIRVQLEPLLKGNAGRNCVLRLQASAFGHQRVAVFVDGKRVTELSADDVMRNYDIDLRCSNSKAGADNEILLELPDAHSPASVGLSADLRKLGIAVTSMTFLCSAERGDREEAPAIGSITVAQRS